MEAMTAVELHALTAPLFEKWPACKPEGLCYGPTGWGDGWLHPAIPTVLPAAVAAALIRVAIEDALREAAYSVALLYTSPYDSDSSGRIYENIAVVKAWRKFPAATWYTAVGHHKIDESPDDSEDAPMWESAYRGYTPLHALVSAALAVAESRITPANIRPA